MFDWDLETNQCGSLVAWATKFNSLNCWNLKNQQHKCDININVQRLEETLRFFKSKNWITYMKYIVYLTKNKLEKVNGINRIYIGVHATENPAIFDGYIGCGVYINQPSTYINPKTPF